MIDAFPFIIEFKVLGYCCCKNKSIYLGWSETFLEIGFITDIELNSEFIGWLKLQKESEIVMLDKEMLKAYQKRWQAVAEIKNAELQRTTIPQRWQQMNALFRLAAALGLQPEDDMEETEIVYQRWNRLREFYISQELE